jgi:hypothetical protein
MQRKKDGDERKETDKGRIDIYEERKKGREERRKERHKEEA